MTKIQILGTGCSKCRELAANAETAAKQMGIDYELIKITDINEIITFGVMITPGLAVNGTVKSTGKLLSPDEIKPLLT